MSTEDVLARIDELAEKYRRAERARDAALAELKHALADAGQVLIDGEQLNRSELIDRSGLSRRTAYDAFNTDPNNAA